MLISKKTLPFFVALFLFSFSGVLSAQPPVDGVEPAEVVEGENPDTPPDDEPIIPAPPALPVEPGVVRLHLHDGAILTGKLAIESFEVETEFGTLIIPVEQIVSMTPGLESQPEKLAEIQNFIEALGGNDYEGREKAGKALLAMGSSIRAELNQPRENDNAERKRRVNDILEELNEMVDEYDEYEESGLASAAWIRLDTVETSQFTVIGKVTPQSFSVQSPYGELAITLEQIRVLEKSRAAAQMVQRRLSVTGENLVQTTWKTTRIRVERGDRISVRAEGALTMTPWGGNQTSSPDGGQNYGVWRDNIQGGTLVARIGSNGDPINVGSRSTFVARRGGILTFAIAMQDQYSTTQGYNFPGKYDLRIEVTPGEG